jgi:hypothetical protein
MSSTLLRFPCSRLHQKSPRAHIHRHQLANSTTDPHLLPTESGRRNRGVSADELHGFGRLILQNSERIILSYRAAASGRRLAHMPECLPDSIFVTTLGCDSALLAHHHTCGPAWWVFGC